MILVEMGIHEVLITILAKAQPTNTYVAGGVLYTSVSHEPWPEPTVRITFGVSHDRSVMVLKEGNCQSVQSDLWDNFSVQYSSLSKKWLFPYKIPSGTHTTVATSK